MAGREELVRACRSLGHADITVWETAGTLCRRRDTAAKSNATLERWLPSLCSEEEKLLAIQEALVPTGQKFQSAGLFLD